MSDNSASSASQWAVTKSIVSARISGRDADTAGRRWHRRREGSALPTRAGFPATHGSKPAGSACYACSTRGEEAATASGERSIPTGHDLSTAPVLRDQLEAVFRTGTAVVVDLSATPFIDSSIIAVLFDANQRTEGSDEKRFGVVVAPETEPERLLGLV